MKRERCKAVERGVRCVLYVDYVHTDEQHIFSGKTPAPSFDTRTLAERIMLIVEQDLSKLFAQMCCTAPQQIETTPLVDSIEQLIREELSKGEK